MAYGFAAAWGARLRLGSVAVASELSLAEHLEDADLLVSGEGRFDVTSLQGKVVGTVLDLAATACVPTAVVAGVVADEFRVGDRVGHLVSLTELAGSDERSMAEPEHYLEVAGRQVARHWDLVHPST